MRKVALAATLLSLALVGSAAAQAPAYTVRADREVAHVTLSRGINEPTVRVTQRTLTGNVVLQVNGVTVRADNAVIKDGEVTFEGNVRLTLPHADSN